MSATRPLGSPEPTPDLPDPKIEETILIYRLGDRPDPVNSLLAAVQHVLASIVGILTPVLVVAGALGLGDQLTYLLSMALVSCGIGTFIQSRGIGPIGARLLCLQGTSFAFVGAIIAAGLSVKEDGGSVDDMLAMIFGLCLAGCFVEIGLSQFIEQVRRIITPTVTGIVITVIGLSLTEIAFTDLAGGMDAADFGDPIQLLTGVAAIAIIVALNFQPVRIVRISAVLIGLIAGSLIAFAAGLATPPSISGDAVFVLPEPVRYGLDFDIVLFIPIALIYFISAIETAGDLTANSVISEEPVRGETYMRRIRGGILGDGVNSAIAAVLGAFPSTTFAQNNGVIQLTGIASRHVALYIAPILVLLGLVPFINGLFAAIPKAVLGGAVLVLFGSIAVAGIRILAQVQIDRKRIFVMAVSFGLGLGVALVPEALDRLPPLLKSLAGSPITVSGLSAILLTLVLPEPRTSKTRSPT